MVGGVATEDGLAEVVTLIDRACDEFCSDPDGCEQAPPVDPPPGGNCEENNDCPSGEACENGECLPIIG